MDVRNKHFKIEQLNSNAGSVLRDVVAKTPFPFWVSAGTVLGLYRDGDFIEGDTDLDFAAVGYDGIDKDIEILGEPIRTIYDGKPMQMAFMIDGNIVDFYFHWKDGDMYYNTSESGKQVMPVHLYDTLETINTKYGDIPVPSPLEEYLTIRYGDWETPKKEKPKNYV